MKIMTMSPNGVDFLIAHEGFKNTAYRDQAGLLTIGVGHLLTKSEINSGKIYIADCVLDMRSGALTDDEVRLLLEHDLLIYEDAVLNAVHVPLSQGQFDALVSFVFNIGEPAFKASTLLRLLNNGDYKAVPVQLQRWNKITVANNKKVVSKGLTKRRLAEATLWKSDGRLRLKPIQNSPVHNEPVVLTDDELAAARELLAEGE